MAAWIKPAAEMGKNHHVGKGNVIRYRARRFILGLLGQTSPHQRAALRAEFFYFHDAYYRGLIGCTVTFERSLPTEEIRALISQKPEGTQ